MEVPRKGKRIRARLAAVSAACVVAVAALAAPAGGTTGGFAKASVTKHFTGHVVGGGSVSFSVLFQNGHPTRAGYFSVRNVPLRASSKSALAARRACTRATFSTQNVVPVNAQRRFSYVFHFSSGNPANIRGQINTGTTAHGTVSYGPRQTDGCSTGGPRNWNAST
jgi:hypothetical protein